MKYKLIPHYQYDWEAKLTKWAKSLGYKSIEYALYHQYVVKRSSFTHMSLQIGISPKSLRRLLVTMGLRIGKGGKQKADIDPRELVIYLETHSRKEAAKKHGVCPQTIWRIKNKYLNNTPCRICGEPREPWNWRSGNCDACRTEFGGIEDNRCEV